MTFSREITVSEVWKKMHDNETALCDLILELMKLTPKHTPSAKALEIAEKMPSEISPLLLWF